VKKYKDRSIYVNVCWEQDNKNQCRTLEKQEAYALKEWADCRDDVVVWWFQALN
jgi:hypothetical protein